LHSDKSVGISNDHVEQGLLGLAIFEVS